MVYSVLEHISQILCLSNLFIFIFSKLGWSQFPCHSVSGVHGGVLAGGFQTEELGG